jgi:hypothetical protein
MLRRYIPGRGYVNLGVKDNKAKIIKSYSTIGGICHLGSYTWESTIACCDITSRCYSLPNLDGGSPSLIPQLFIDGGNPLTVPECFIDGGNP